jgi:hypothetical protein
MFRDKIKHRNRLVYRDRNRRIYREKRVYIKVVVRYRQHWIRKEVRNLNRS